MVSQNQDGIGWDGNGSPSRTGSLLSLDGRQRPAPAKTPPSYYDAVRSRHSLSQPRPSDGSKQDKVHQGQQVKYNSLPRPLPQRYPPTSTNGQQHRPWPDDHYDPARLNANQPWRPGDPAPRQLYDSPPKPANHVPLQLQVHNQERYLVKRGPEQTESCSPPGLLGPRGNDQPRISSDPRAERLTVDCGARGNSMEMMRKESIRSLPPCPDVRSPPALPPGGRFVHPRVPPSHGEHNTNSLPRRDPNHSSGLSRRYIMSSDGSPMPSSNYPARSPMNGMGYEPRYSKSGKLYPRPLSQGFESRPMPPPAVQLRTGPLGSYPDAETLKRSEMLAHNRGYDDFNKQAHRPASHGDISKQIYVDTNSYTNGQSVITDHLAIPYRIPQVSPKSTRPLFEGCNGIEGRTEPPPSLRGQPQTSTVIKGIKNQQLSTCPRPGEDHTSPVTDHRSRRFHEASTMQYKDSLQTYNNQNIHSFNKIPPPSPDSRSQISDNSVIYANHQMSFNSIGINGHCADPRSPQKRSPTMTNGNSVFYENHLPKSCPRDIQDMSDDTTLYANQHMTNARYKSPQQEISHLESSFQNDTKNNFSNFRSPHNSQKNQHPPPTVAQKPRPTLPQPSEMIMVTETRGWNGQASSYPKDVVKPTPRMPRLANIATGTHLTAVPAYQCVINELSSQTSNQTLPRSSDSSTLSLRSGYDSSSSSVRDFGRQPSKSDSSIDMRKLSEGGLKSPSSQQRIDKTFLSASMTSLCSDSSSSVSTRRYHRYHNDDPNWDRMTEEFQKRKDKGAIFSASPWEREEKEKLQREQISDARRARDQEIALLESMPDRNEKQEEWLRILRLEREFQRRAEQEMKEDEDEDEEDDDVIEKRPAVEEENKTVESFHGDKMNTISNERLGLKLLDELLENSPKPSTTEKQELPKSPSEKHFILLECTTSENLPQASSLCTGISYAQMLDQNHFELNSNRLSKPPIPAPRPSKTPVILKSDLNLNDQITDSESDINLSESDLKVIDSNIRNLSKIDISDSSYYHNDSMGRDTLQDNWLFEVSSFENGSVLDMPMMPSKQNGEHKEESRIYENIMEFQSQKRHHPSQNGYGSHTLPKSNTHLTTKEILNTRSNHSEKKFPAMGVSSTLSRKHNGHIPNDSDILPALYASSKVKSGYQRDIPSELEDKSPEFKKLWTSRPEKLTFQDKIRKFSIQAGEDDIPRDRVKNSRAQREIEIKFNEGQKKIVSNVDT